MSLSRMRPLNSALDYSQFGAADGHTVIYFHGMQGSAEECQVFDCYGKANNLTIIAYQRSTIDWQLQGAAYYQRIAHEIMAQVAGKPVDMVGFSIGAFIALQVCRVLNGKVRSLHLISAAAPLDADHFIDVMAGKAVFRLARNHPRAFLGLVRFQGLLMRFSPSLLFRLLFSSAAGADQSLATDKAFRTMINCGLKTCFSHPQAYAHDINAYVQPWQQSLADINVNTTLWHGTADNWSPICMADYFKSALPNASTMTSLDGLSHYSCLYKVASTLCQKINQEFNRP